MNAAIKPPLLTFAAAYPPPWRIRENEIVDRHDNHVHGFDDGNPYDLVFWQGICDAVYAAATEPTDVVAPPDMGAVLALRGDPDFQAALQRYAHGNGSSEAVALALLTASRFWTLRIVLQAAVHALRSYQFGNASPDLAQSIADMCVTAMQPPAPGGA